MLARFLAWSPWHAKSFSVSDAYWHTQVHTSVRFTSSGTNDPSTSRSWVRLPPAPSVLQQQPRPGWWLPVYRKLGKVGANRPSQKASEHMRIQAVAVQQTQEHRGGTGKKSLISRPKRSAGPATRSTEQPGHTGSIGRCVSFMPNQLNEWSLCSPRTATSATSPDCRQPRQASCEWAHGVPKPSARSLRCWRGALETNANLLDLLVLQLDKQLPVHALSRSRECPRAWTSGTESSRIRRSAPACGAATPSAV